MFHQPKSQIHSSRLARRRVDHCNRWYHYLSLDLRPREKQGLSHIWQIQNDSSQPLLEIPYFQRSSTPLLYLQGQFQAVQCCQCKKKKKPHWRLLIRLKVFLTIPRDRLTRICTVPGICMTDVHLDWQTFEKEWYQRHGRGYLLLDGITKLCLYPFPWMYQFYFHDKMCCYPFNRVNWEGDLFKVHVTVTEI